MASRRAVGGELLVGTAAALWALIGVCARELGDLGMPAEDVGAWRALIGGACFVAHLLVRGNSAPADPGPAPAGHSPAGHNPAGHNPAGHNPAGHNPAGHNPAGRRRVGAGAVRADLGPLVGFMVVGVVVFYAALPLAVETGGISLAYVLLYTAPIWVMIGATVFLHEHITRAHLVAGVVSVLGVVALVAAAGGTVDVTAVSVTWGLLSGFSYASYYILGRRLFDRLGAILVYALVLPVGGVLLAVGVGVEAPTAAMVGWLALLGIACTYLPYLLFGMGITRTGSARAVVVAMVEPVLATLIGVLAYGERLGLLGAVGAAAVLGAAVSAGVTSGSDVTDEYPRPA